MEELNKKIPQLPWIVAVIGIVIAGYFFLSMSKVNTELNNRQCELNAYQLKLEQFEKLESVYGHGSDKYYAKQPILILRTAKNEGRITIFWDSSNLTVPAETTPAIKYNTKMDVKWAEGWYGEGNHLSDLIVTPSNNAGCYPITFTNNVSDDKFQVLVIVK